jgi:hypothetical protein
MENSGRNKIFVYENILGYKKAQPIIRVKGFKFNESDFKVQLDLQSFKGLNVGETFVIDKSFYFALHGALLDWNLSQEFIVPMHHTQLSEIYILIAFVEMTAKNCNEMFCILMEDGSSKIIKTKDESLGVFWLEGLKKIESK